MHNHGSRRKDAPVSDLCATLCEVSNKSSLQESIAANQAPALTVGGEAQPDRISSVLAAQLPALRRTPAARISGDPVEALVGGHGSGVNPLPPERMTLPNGACDNLCSAAASQVQRLAGNGPNAAIPERTGAG
jgi:hypothetical protein